MKSQSASERSLKLNGEALQGDFEVSLPAGGGGSVGRIGSFGRWLRRDPIRLSRFGVGLSVVLVIGGSELVFGGAGKAGGRQ